MSETPESRDRPEFEALARGARSGFMIEFWLFLKDNKKWWLAPILTVILGFGLLVMLAGSGAAPFIYTLF